VGYLNECKKSEDRLGLRFFHFRPFFPVDRNRLAGLGQWTKMG
jgi:hypothetical protein